MPIDGTRAQALFNGLLVFINPTVASLPRHSHLFGGHGCYGEVIDNFNGGLNCTNPVDHLPREYQSLLDCKKDPIKTNDVNDYLNRPWICSKNKNLSK